MLLAADAPGSAADGLGDHWLAVIIVAAIVLVVILVLAMLAKYLRLAVNLFLDTPLPVTSNLRDFTLPEGEIVTFPNLEGRSLRGMFIDRPPGAPRRGVVIFCHEFGSDMMSAGRYAWPLVQAGYTVFTFDFRGHGSSYTPPRFEPRHWPSNHEVDDIRAAVAYVQSRGEVDRTGVGILGISRGASAAVIAAALNPAIRCLVVDGVFSTDHSIDELMKRWVQVFARVDLARATRTMAVYRFFRALLLFYVELKCRCRFPSTRRALGRLEAVPILFIQGGRDAYVRPEWTQVLYDLKAGPKELWICADAKHNQAVATDPKTYAHKITGFFDRHLPAEPPAAAGGLP
jgi:pimeloyl-ACP methyl ester carboxylesterase